MNKIVLVTILQAVCYLVVQAEDTQTDYCDKALCTIRQVVKKHIGCNAVDRPSPGCGPNYQHIDLEPYKDYIADKHNFYRNMIANGEVKGFRPAVRMAKMEWDKELAKLANLNAIKCQFEHDECRNTKRFLKSGQNIYMGMNDENPQRLVINYFIDDAVKAWFNEHVNSTQDQIKAYYSTSEHDKDRITGHFTQIVNDKSNRIGCGAVTFGPGEKYKNHNLLVCNYARTNLLGHPVYVAGKAGSKCQNGRDSKFKALCDTTEPINPNDFSKQ